MKTVKHWQLEQQKENEIILQCDNRHSLHIFVLEHDLIRVLFQQNRQLRLNRTWTVAPENDEIPGKAGTGLQLMDTVCQSLALSSWMTSYESQLISFVLPFINPCG